MHLTYLKRKYICQKNDYDHNVIACVAGVKGEKTREKWWGGEGKMCTELVGYNQTHDSF